MASTLLSVTQVADLLETTLKATDEELGRLIDSADSAIQKVYGPHVTEDADNPREIMIYNDSYSHSIYLPYPPAASVSEIKEYASYEHSSEAETLDPDENDEDKWDLEFGGRVIRRPMKRFQQRVIVKYVPVDDTEDRRHILIDLVRLADQFSGVKSEEFGIGRSGGAATEHVDYVKEWNRILNRMRPMAPGIMFV